MMTKADYKLIDNILSQRHDVLLMAVMHDKNLHDALKLVSVIWPLQVGFAIFETVHNNVCDIHSLSAMAVENGPIENLPRWLLQGGRALAHDAYRRPDELHRQVLCLEYPIFGPQTLNAW